MRLELITIPVSEIDRAKEFYVDKLGFHLDGDFDNGNNRFIQLTPVGTACSIAIGKGITQVKPGSIDSILLVVKDIHEAHDELVSKGVEVSDIEETSWGAWHIYLSDPDGNKLTLQQKSPANADW